MSRIVEGCVVRKRCQVQLMDRQRELQIGRHFANCHLSEDTDTRGVDARAQAPQHRGGKGGERKIAVGSDSANKTFRPPPLQSGTLTPLRRSTHVQRK